MNLLLVDAGNARLKWVVSTAGELGVTHFAQRDRDGYRALAALCEAASEDVERIVVSNVAGREFEQRLKQALARQRPERIWFARTTAEAGGVRNAYARPERLGIDRWAAMLGAFARVRASESPAPVCVVDAGTALTIDAVKSDGVHLGGLILPGLALQRTALFGATADVSAGALAVRDPPQGLAIFATDTDQALALSGALACAAAVDRCVNALAAHLQRPRVMLAGGDAGVLAPWLASGFEICPNLVFEGLAILFEQRSSD
ncbi:MAG: type III pantothenate kinase [Gammaproteobacteria bacterium]|jgi:type III pantothenate kinase